MQQYTTPIILFFFSLLFAYQLSAQEPNNEYKNTGGLIVEEDEIDKFPVDTTTYVNQKGDYQNIPESYSLRRFCPIAGKQDSSTCVGWAVAYGAYTIMRAIDSSYLDRNCISEQTAFSPMYLFNKGNGNLKDGMTLSKAMEVLIHYGVCLKSTYNPIPLTVPPSFRANEEAKQYDLPQKYKDVKHIFTWWNWSNTKIKLTEIYLSKNRPVIVGFRKAPSSTKKSKKWYPAREGIDAKHAMVVVGYDRKTQLFELLNSNGSGHGKDGFLEISYEDFAQYAVDAYILKPPTLTKGGGETEKKYGDISIQMEGSLELLEVGEKDSLSLMQVQQDASVSSKYKLKKLGLKLKKDYFKLQLDIPQYRGAYVFSIDATNRASLIWNMDWAEEGDTSVVLPQQGVFLLENKGIENLVVLFTYSIIENMNPLLQQLEETTENIEDRLQQVFGEYLIDSEFIEYDAEKIAFTSLSKNGKGIAVPIIVPLEGVE